MIFLQFGATRAVIAQGAHSEITIRPLSHHISANTNKRQRCQDRNRSVLVQKDATARVFLPEALHLSTMEMFNIDTLINWLAVHPGWAGFAVFFIALTESLAIVGLFMPGSFLMFGIGALVAVDALPLWPTLALAAVGAVAGDGLSYWLGRHYHMQLKVLWPFSRYPRLIARGVDYFHAHGGKSVLMARFFGPVRPILPAVAGMLEMSPTRFLLVNIASALLWAPAYLLPGLVFGASLGLAAEVATRLMLLLALLSVLLWLGLWLVLRVTRYLQPRTEANIGRVWRWSQRHPHLGRLSAALVDPEHPEPRALALLGLMLLAAGWAFFFVLWQVIGETGPLALDTTVYHFFQGLRTPSADRLLVFITELGDAAVYLPVGLAVFIWLLWRRRVSAALHWLAAIGFGIALTQLLKAGLQVPRPIDIYTGASAFSFPSGHAVMGVTVYGFLAVLIARELAPRHRRWAYLGAALFIIPIAFSRLYLGAHWLSDVVGGLFLGLAAVALLGLAYRRHPAPPIRPKGLLAVAMISLMMTDGWNVQRQFEHDVSRYAYQPEITSMGMDTWWREGWQRLPGMRHDVRGKAAHPLNLQWLADLNTVRDYLTRQGWHEATPLTLKNSLRLLAPALALNELPVLPQVHDSRHEVLRWIKQDGEDLIVIRLWASQVRLTDTGTPLWIGNVSRLRRQHLGPFSYPATDTDFTGAFQRMREAMRDTDWEVSLNTRRDGRQLLLLRPPPGRE